MGKYNTNVFNRVINLGGAAALTLAAGQVSAALFTFTPLCNSNWGTICNLGPNSCAGGGILFRNNWAQTGCNVNPGFPGGGDDVVIGVNAALDVSPAVRTVTINSGVSFAFQGSMTTSAGFTNNGSVSTSGAGNLNYAGPFTNSVGATWIENSNGRFLANATFANAGLLELQSISLLNNGGTNGYTNTGTIRKTTSGTASFSSVPLTNNATIDVQAGPLNFSGTTYTGSSTSTINVAGTNGAAFNLNSYTLVGRINGTGVGEINSGTVTASGATIFNVASNLRLSGDLNATAIVGSSFTNNNRVTTSGAGNLNYSGPVTNSASGIWVENSNSRFFASCPFTNAGILELQSISLQNNGGANSITNSGTIRKVGAATAAINGIPLSNSGLIDVQAGTLNVNSVAYTGVGTGSVSVATGATCNFNSVNIGGTINFTGAGALVSNGPLTVSGTASLNTTSAFQLLGDVTVGGANSLTNRGLLSTSGAGNINYTGTLTNGPTGTWIENSNTRFFANSSFVNNGTWELQSISLAANGGTNSLINNATMRKVGAATASANIPITNNAAISVQAGTLNFNNTVYTAVPTASINVSSGANLNLNTMTLAGTVNCTGTGNFVSTGTLTVAGNVTTSTTSALQIVSNLTVNPGNSLTNQGLISTSGAGNLNYSGPIVNGNNGTWIENSNTRFFGGSSFVNNGVWELQSINLAANGGVNTLTNNATVRKTAAGTASTNIPFTNNGAFNVLAGNLNFSNTSYTGNGAAAFNISAPADVNFGSMTIVGTLRATGAGAIGSTGILTASGNAVLNSIPSFALLGDVNATGVGNSLTNAGNVSTSGGGNLTYQGTVTNTGTWVENSNTRFYTGFVFNNQGTLDVRSINLAANGGTNAINNSGTMLKTTASAFTTNVPVTNTGLVDVQAGTASFGSYTQSAANARTLVRSGATLAFAPTLSNGSLEGRGTIGSATSVTGARINPGDPVSGGTLTFAGTLTMSPTSSMQIDLSAQAAVPFDRVVTAGTVAVAGTLVVNIVSPFYPILGDVYEIVRTTAPGATPRTGTFSSVIVNADPGIAVAVSYTSNSVRLTVTDTTCDQLDFNRDGLFPDDSDLIDFLSVLAGGPCSTSPTPGCADIDFNNDGLFPDDSDLVDFLTVLAGGPC